ncbi:hypothetical protein J0X19_07890 [Hymenobacter sp. BT186]|uniref:Uncharacterized protein n=1 Tax=Hymenobacter telluris TaxID=2816474 RepID=A0A939EWH1_9BACT|nr:hypothetical protein [Hymenobacter telluris]MBO0357862.1 hypothetical protein [Hymenobacter telluris]MBW3373889.1 hypothetical protein [Hymenobacter norwichensis]
MELLATIQPHAADESVFRTKREKINAQIALVYAQLKIEAPKTESADSRHQVMREVDTGRKPKN